MGTVEVLDDDAKADDGRDRARSRSRAEQRKIAAAHAKSLRPDDPVLRQDAKRLPNGFLLGKCGGFPYLPRNLADFNNYSELQDAGWSMMNVGESLMDRPVAVSGTAEAMARARQLWDQCSDLGAAIRFLGTWLHSLLWLELAYCTHCYRHRATARRCHVHKATGGEYSRAVYEAEQIKDSFREGCSSTPNVGDWSAVQSMLLAKPVGVRPPSQRAALIGERLKLLYDAAGPDISMELEQLAATLERERTRKGPRSTDPGGDPACLHFWRRWYEQQDDRAHLVLSLGPFPAAERAGLVVNVHVLFDLHRLRAWRDANRSVTVSERPRATGDRRRVLIAALTSDPPQALAAIAKDHKVSRNTLYRILGEISSEPVSTVKERPLPSQ